MIMAVAIYQYKFGLRNAHYLKSKSYHPDGNQSNHLLE